jgi:UDP-glucose 4-epimerase
MIVVTGATGFVGRYLVDHLAKSGKRVIACGRTLKYDSFFKAMDVPFVQLDVAKADSFDSLPEAPIEGFVHLAAVIPAAVLDTKTDVFLRVNALGTFNALEFCRKRKVGRFVYITTLYECLGHSKLPITEAMGRKFDLTGDHASYVISKMAACEYVEHYAAEYGIRGVILRFTGLLGYGRQEGFYLDGTFHPSAFEQFYRRAKAGEALEVWGEHKAKRDSLYVKDAVRAIHAALDNERARGLYIVASGIGRTTEEETRVFAEVFGSKDHPIPIKFRPEIEDKKKSYYFDISKAKSELGWSPIYSYADILRDYDKEVQSGRFRT